jgi:hypothetical protein
MVRIVIVHLEASFVCRHIIYHLVPTAFEFAPAAVASSP